MLAISSANAAVVPSSQVIQKQQSIYTSQQISALLDSSEVQANLIKLGVNPADAKMRISHMTDQELASFHEQMQDMPAGGGVVGTIVTVLVVLAVLDVVGITDVYSFIRPIN